MAAASWDHSDEFDDVILIAAADEPRRRELRDGLSHVKGRRKSEEVGAYPRFKIVTASTGPEARRRAPGASIALVDLLLPKGPGLEIIQELRGAHPHLAILAFAESAGASDAMAAVMAGADMFHSPRDGAKGALLHSVELAVDRRRLTHAIERNEEELQEARTRLAKLSGELVGAVPGLWPLRSRQDVLPFREAARRYLLAATKLYDRDARGLASALGLSYFALRRLLARYDVAFPGARSRRSEASQD